MATQFDYEFNTYEYIDNTSYVKFIGTSLENCEIPPTVQNGNYTVLEIGSGVQTNWNSLKTLIIPNTVTKINDYAFVGCSNLTSVSFIGNSVTSIGQYAFCGTSLTTIAIPSEVTVINNNTFAGCTNLTSIIFNGNNITSIGNFAFTESGLISIIIPSNIETINVYAFGDCSNLTNVTFAGDNVTSIGEYAFGGTGLTTITIPSKVNSIGDSIFNGCTYLTSIIFNGNNITSIGLYAFTRSGLTTIIIPSNVETIHSNAFSDCYSLTNVTFAGNNVTLIGEYAFGSTSLTTITIPSSVINIQNSTFMGCNKLTNIIFLGNNLQYIGNYLFKDCSMLTSIIIPNSVVSIGESAFENCSSLTYIKFPSAPLNIRSSAFNNCNNIYSMYIPSSILVYEDAFSGCENLTNIYFGGLVTFRSSVDIDSSGLSNYSLYYTDSINTDLSDYIKISIDTNTDIIYALIAMIDNTNYTQDTAIVIGNNLSNVTSTCIIPKNILNYNVTLIESNAFFNLTTLNTITISENITSINNYAFYGCSNLTTVYFNHLAGTSLPIINVNSNLDKTNFTINGDTAKYILGVTNLSYLDGYFDTITVNTPVCYNYDTKILCKMTTLDKPEYIPIQNLRKGMLVKTYLDGYKKIEYIGKQTLVNNPLNSRYGMYKLRKINNNKLFEDLIVTYDHSILVKKIDETDFSYGKIHDLYLVRASNNKLFEKILDNENYEYYDFVLENDNNMERYGVWANGILSESCSKYVYLKHNFIELV